MIDARLYMNRDGNAGIVFIEKGKGVIAGLSPLQVRLLVELRNHGTLRRRQLAGTLYPDRDDALSASVRASLSRSVRLLATRGLVVVDGQALKLSETGLSWVDYLATEGSYSKAIPTLTQ